MHREPQDIPDTLLSSRLLIRCPRAGDGFALLSALQQASPARQAWPARLPWPSIEPTLAATEAFCRRARLHYPRGRTLGLLLYLRADGSLLGASGLQTVDRRLPEYRLGYWSRPNLPEPGLLVEALATIARFARHSLGARRLSSHIAEDDPVTRRIAEQAGFALQQRLPGAPATSADAILRATPLCLYALHP